MQSFDAQSQTFRLATFASCLVESPVGTVEHQLQLRPMALELATIGYYYSQQRIYCSECSFNWQDMSDLADVHFASMPGCVVAMRHKQCSPGPNHSPSGISIAGPETLNGAPVTAGTSSSNASQERGTSNPDVAAHQNERPPFASLQARIDSFEKFQVPNGNIHARYGLYMETEYRVKCCGCGLDNFDIGCLYDARRGWENALEIHKNQKPDCDFISGHASSFV